MSHIKNELDTLTWARKMISLAGEEIRTYQTLNNSTVIYRVFHVDGQVLMAGFILETNGKVKELLILIDERKPHELARLVYAGLDGGDGKVLRLTLTRRQIEEGNETLVVFTNRLEEVAKEIREGVKLTIGSITTLPLLPRPVSVRSINIAWEQGDKS